MRSVTVRLRDERVRGGRGRAARTGSSDSGFTVVELLVAMLIIGGVLFSLVAVQTAALVTTAQSRQRTQATAVANEVMEELRALPWLVLSRGLHSNFAAAAGGDPNITGGRLRPVANPSIDEVLVTDSNQLTDKRPLSGAGGSNLVVDLDASGSGLTFSTRTYVTRNPGTAPDVATLTVITSWTPVNSARPKSVLVRSTAYAPAGGCGDAANQPFLGACQALLSSGAGATGPATTVTAASAGPGFPAPTSSTPILPGSAFTVATLVGGQAGVSITSQQATSVDSSVLHAGTSLATADSTVVPSTTGQSKSTNAASNDVGAAGAAPSNPADATSMGTATPASITWGGIDLRLTPSSSVSGTARASMVVSCTAGIPAGQGCGSATSSGGTASTVGLTVDGAAFTVSSVAAGATASTYGGRFSSAVGATTIGCAVLTGPGCVAAGVQRTVGTSTFGGGAWAGAAAPSGLVTVTGYTDAVRVERGMSQRTATAVSSRSAQIAVWNGTGYSTVTVNRSTAQTLTTPTVSWAAGASTVQVSATVTVTPAMSIASNPDPALCGGEGCTIDADTGTITVALTWVVTAGGSVNAFSSATTLGGSRANAAYKAAPGA